MTGPLKFRLNPPQSRALRAVTDRKTICLAWGRGVGKSWFIRLACWYLLSQARQDGKPVRIIALAPTLKQWRDIHEQHLLGEVNDTWAFLGGKLDRTTLQITFPDGSWWKPFPSEFHTSRTARGQRCDAVVIDEADDIPISVFHSVVKPWFSEPWSRKIVIAGGTPRLGRKGLLYDLFARGNSTDPLDGNYVTVYATWRDAPEQVDPDTVAEAQRTTPPSIFKREWEEDFDAAEGLVYGDVFDERFHVRPAPEGIRFNEVLIGGDAGWEDPGVLLVIGVQGSGEDAVCWVVYEICERHQTQDWWCDRMRQLMDWYPTAVLYHDPSRPDLVKAYEKVGARPRQTDNSIEAGIAAVANRLQVRGTGENRSARLYVDPSCKNLIWEMGAYKRRQDPHDPDRYLDEIVDRNNHGQDSLRYSIASRFGKPLNYRTEVRGA